MRTRNLLQLLLASLALLALSGCGGSQSPSQTAAAQPQTPGGSTTATGDEPANPGFIGRIWRSTALGSPLGSIMVFLPDRTLLMDSCFETYRVSKWGVAGQHIRWLEDTVPIEAEVKTPGKDELILKIVGQDREQTYVAMTEPYKCPDMPR